MLLLLYQTSSVAKCLSFGGEDCAGLVRPTFRHKIVLSIYYLKIFFFFFYVSIVRLDFRLLEKMGSISFLIF